MVNSSNKHGAGARSLEKAASPQAEGHVLLPAVAITGMSLGLALGLDLLGVVARINDTIAAAVSRSGAEKFPKHLTDLHAWLAALLLAFGLSAAMCGTPGVQRRVLLWGTATLLVGTWAPVLSLAAHRPEIAVPWIATFWAGFCAMMYTSRNRLPSQPTRPFSR
jgi:hypothetical protein